MLSRYCLYVKTSSYPADPVDTAFDVLCTIQNVAQMLQIVSLSMIRRILRMVSLMYSVHHLKRQTNTVVRASLIYPADPKDT